MDFIFRFAFHPRPVAFLRTEKSFCVWSFACKFLFAMLTRVCSSLCFSVCRWTSTKSFVGFFPAFSTAKMVFSSFFTFVFFAACFAYKGVIGVVVVCRDMRSIRNTKGQIFNTVICRITIDVMHNLVWFKRATKMLFHNKTVSILRFLSVPYLNAFLVWFFLFTVLHISSISHLSV